MICSDLFKTSYGKAGLEGSCPAPQIHDADVGKIIGTGGANIRELQRGTGCRIDIPRKREENEEVALRRTRNRISATGLVDFVLLKLKCSVPTWTRS